MQTIGERIVFLREELDISQIKLADKVGLTNTTLYKYEKNICEPKGEIIARLASALNTTADFILGRTPDFSPLKKESGEESFRKQRENELVQSFRRLSDENKARVEERIYSLLEAQSPAEE